MEWGGKDNGYAFKEPISQGTVTKVPHEPIPKGKILYSG